MSFIWNERNIAHLKEMWSKGLTAARIAVAIGAPSRNAVVKKAHRLGLPGRPSPIKRGVTPKRRVYEPRPSNNPKGRARTINHERVGELFGQGLTDNEIGARLNCSGRYVWTVRHNMGLTRPKFSPDSNRRAIAMAAERQFSLELATRNELPQTSNATPVALVARLNGDSEEARGSFGVPLADLSQKGCRWPVSSNGRAHLFCGERNDGLSPYCCEHHEKARGKPAADTGNLANIEMRRVA